jgi:lipoprotein NlpI
LLVLLLLTFQSHSAAAAETRQQDPEAAEHFERLLVEARKALRDGRAVEAAELAGRAVAADGKNAEAYYLRGTARDAIGMHAAAVDDLGRAIEIQPKYAAPYDARGSAHFKLAHIKESIADFDKYLELEPHSEPGHWRRGISYYYAGRFAEGARQFEGYQTVDDNDVENAVWHFLCNARAGGIQKARGALLKIGRDPRVPLMTVYAMFRGVAKPDDVLAATRESNPPAEVLKQRLFYAHLYLGLYYEAAGDADKSLEHMRQAVEDYKLPGYMWEVARVHVALREREKK